MNLCFFNALLLTSRIAGSFAAEPCRRQLCRDCRCAAFTGAAETTIFSLLLP